MEINRKHAFKVKAEFRGVPYEFQLYTQEWQGDRIRFYFEDNHFNNTGYIDLQADTGALEINIDKPYPQLDSQEAVTNYILSICQHFVTRYTHSYSPEDDMIAQYDAEYHRRSGYLNPSDLEIKVKTFQADIIKRLAAPRKAVVAGCSSGLLVQKLRELGRDTWGFDVIPDLTNHALPGMTPFLREGGVQNVPFTKQDNIDTFIAIDVLEHIPEKYVANMVQEWLRLDIQKLVLMINFTQSNFEGHVTLRSPSWWARQWQSHFVLKSTFQREVETLYSNDNDFNHQITYWERVKAM